MANYHCAAKVISRSSGRSSTGAAAYRAAEVIHDERTGLTHDYANKRGVDLTLIIAPDHAPNWVHDRGLLWNAVEKIEKRRDAQLCREIEISIPTELNNKQKLELVQGYVREQFVNRGMIADVSFHKLESQNPHAHILLTMRDISHDGFGNKNRGWNDRKLIEEWRMEWANSQNRAFEKLGLDVRVDHRSYEDQGINKIPQVHMGPAVAAMESYGIRTEIGNQNRVIADDNENIIYLEHARERISREIRSLEILENQIEHRTDQTIENSRAVGNGDPAASSGNGRTHRPDMGGAGSAEAGIEKSDAGIEQYQPADHRPVKPIDSAIERGNEQRHESQQKPDTKNNIDRHRYGSAIDNIISLSARPKTERGGATANEQGHGVGKSVAETNTTSAGGNAKTDELEQMRDKTMIAVNRQLAAMGGAEFEIGIRDSSGRMLSRTWSADQVRKSIGWLRRENAKGADIYIRPAGAANQGLILVDDLNLAQLARMKAAGCEPALVTETSPQNLQAWIRVSDKPLPPAVATRISQSLAKQFGGDPNSADWRHYGRLAGFTNAKPEHKNEIGQSPWVLCQESTGRTAQRGAELVQWAFNIEQQHQASLERSGRLKAAQNAPERVSGRDPVAEYRRQLKALSAQYGQGMDVSKADYMICKDMARRGYSPDELKTALEQASPELPTRKAGHEADYVARTVSAAINAVEHEKQLEAKNQPEHKPRGFSGPKF